MALQHSHTTIPFSKNKFPLIVLCDGLRSPANIGSLFRVCDAFGVAQILFYNGTIDINSSRLKRTARKTYKSVNYAICVDINTTIKKLRKKGYDIIALEISKISTPSESITLDEKGAVLIIGNERSGISEEVLSLTSKHMHIEMYGENSSMNVIQAASIGLYTIVNKMKQSH